MSQPSPKVIILARHGRTEENSRGVAIGSTDAKLSRCGEQEAAALASWLEGRDIDTLTSSSLDRAIATSERISAITGVANRIDPDLRERDLGPFEGLSRVNLLRKRSSYGLSDTDPTQAWEGCEVVEQDGAVAARAFAAIGQVMATDVQTAVFVTHAGVITSLWYAVYEVPRRRRCCLHITTGGAIVFKLTSQGWELVELWPNPHATRIGEPRGRGGISETPLSAQGN